MLLVPYLKQLPKSSPHQGGVSVNTASAKGKPPVKSTHGGDVTSSRIIVYFWTANDYSDLQGVGDPICQNINIRDEACNTAQTTDAKQKIEALIRQAALQPRNARGLRIKTGPPIFEFERDCQIQWLPVYNYFDIKVVNGERGECENDKCMGQIFLETSNGLLADLVDGTFYDTTKEADYDRLEEHHEHVLSLQSHH